MSRTTTTELMGIALNVEGDTAPEWVQLLPAGPRMKGRDGREWIMPRPEAVVEAFALNKAELPIDFEHATQVKGDRGERADAVGHIIELEARNGEVWGRVSWNDTGREALVSRAYRYLSPVFKFSKSAREITRIVSAGLTNLPNLHVTALNKEAGEEETAMNPEILEALGLKDGASDGDVLTAINRIKTDERTARNRAEQPDADKFVPKADYEIAMNRVREFETAEAERAGAEIEAAVDAATEAGKIAPASRDYHIAACRQEGGLERFQKMVDAAPEQLGKSKRADNPKPGGSALSPEETAVCRQLGMTEKDFAEAKAKEKA